MKIKTNLYLMSVIFVIVITAIGLVMFHALSQISREIKKSNISSKLVKDIFELNIVTNEYTMYHEKRMREQWHIKYNSLDKELEIIRKMPLSPEHHFIIQSIITNYKGLGDLFTQLQGNFDRRKRMIEKNKPQVKIARDVRIEKLLTDEIMLRSQRISTQAFKLSDMMQQRIYQVEHKTNLIILFSIIGFAFLSFFASFYNIRTLVEQIQKLIKGADIIGRGDLEYRVETKTKNEIGQLAISFNEMTFQLGESKKKLNDYALNLEEKEEKYRTLVQTIPDIIYKIDENGCFTFLNNSIRTLGYEPEEIIGKHFSMILHPDDVESCSRSVVLQKYANKVTGDEKAPNFFDERRTKDRMTRNLEIRLMPKIHEGRESNTTGIEGPITSFCEVTATGDYEADVSIKDKKLLGTLGIIRNISEKIKLQAESIRAGQLAATGELAAGVAHEINNPIYGIINLAQLVVDESDKDSRAHKFGKLIMEEGNRIADLTNKLLSLSRSTTGKKRPVQIYELISNSLKLTKVQLEKDNIIFKDNISKDIPAIIANPQEIHQVFLNLIQNARYALNEKYSDKDKDKILEISCNKVLIDDYEYVRIIFYDRGIGIPENILTKVISPFFTTKSPAKGTGIGLSISQNIISNHNGKMTIESIPGEFTKVVIDLPATELTIKK